MGTVYARRRAVARLLAVCAVLFGLFLMHGAPATAASGCHDAMPVSTSVEHVGQADSGRHGVTSMSPAATSHAPPHAVPQTGSGGHGAQCVATPARERLLLAPVWALAAVAVAVSSLEVLAGRGLAAREAGRRGPPGGGRELLLRVCIARR
ncbi:hypothetical protein [Streptomyces yatensis]|uniref:Secreted protein n=1 Tax=Streptomyces yatensis TaxID=155177 RepID=A0ABN2IQE5_9ACTN|nr:hypothetical protein [Streptomyces yatensis]